MDACNVAKPRPLPSARMGVFGVAAAATWEKNPPGLVSKQESAVRTANGTAAAAGMDAEAERSRLPSPIPTPSPILSRAPRSLDAGSFHAPPIVMVPMHTMGTFRPEPPRSTVRSGIAEAKFVRMRGGWA
eukprot:358439-Chlamydomonas_euryale.AAC.11